MVKFKFKGKEYYIDGFLQIQLDSLVYNINDDWDFVILITGDRTVRVGKSVLGMTVSAYLASRLMQQELHPDPYTVNDIYFDNKEMMKAAFKKEKYSINHYDEGREGLAANKAMSVFQKDLLDFFAECGQLNQMFVIVLPDFFELKEEIAVPRSEILLNVYRGTEKRMVDLYKTGSPIPVVKFTRGNFQFFNRTRKLELYDKAKTLRRKNYGLVKANFIGSFTNQYPIDEESYKQKKRDSLARFSARKEEEKEQLKPHKADIIRDSIIIELHAKGITYSNISRELESKYGYKISPRQIGDIVKKNEGGSVLEVGVGENKLNNSHVTLAGGVG